MRTTLKKVEFDKVFPLLGISEEGVAISRKGALTLGWEIILPVMYTRSEEDYDGMIHAMDSAIRILPAWYTVVRQDIYTYEYWAPDEDYPSGFFAESEKRHFMGRKYLVHKAYIFVTMTTKGLITKKSSYSGLFGIADGCIIPARPEYELFLAKTKEFAAILTSGSGISLTPLSFNDWAGTPESPGIIHRYMFLGERTNHMSDFELSNESIGCFDRKAQVYNLYSSEKLPPIVNSIRKNNLLSTEGNPVYQSLGAAIGAAVDCEHIVNSIFVIPDQAEEKARLEDEFKKMRAGNEDDENAISQKELQLYKEKLINESPYTIKANISIIAWDIEENYGAIAGKITSALSMLGTSVTSRVKYNAPLLWYAGIPGNVSEIGSENLMTMELSSALCFNNWDTFQRNIKGGTLRICDRNRHSPIVFDTQHIAMKRGWIYNLNAFILGPSGTGKSFFMNFYLRNVYDAGGNCFLIDRGDSYELLCAVINEESGGRDGQYISWDAEHPLKFNPFIGYKEWLDENGNTKADSIGANFFISVLETIWAPVGGWTSDTEPILKQTITDFLRNEVPEIEKAGRKPIFQDYYVFLKDKIAPLVAKSRYSVLGNTVHKEDIDMGKMLKALSAYSVEGVYGFLQNEENPADIFTSRFVVFEVTALSSVKDEKFYSLCILFIMHQFDMKMRQKVEEFDVMVIEEAWKAISNETMAPYLRELWKTARKFNTSAVVVTQSMSDILSSDVIKDAILANSSTKILLDQSEARKNFDPIADALSLTANDRMKIFSMNMNKDPRYEYRDVFIKLGEGFSDVFSTEASPEEAVAFDSRKEEKAPHIRRAKELGSYREAIMEAVNEKKE